MQRLSVRLLLLTAVLVFSGAAFSKTSDAAPVATRQVYYYWYSWPDDTYNDEETAAYETNEMWIYYDAWVDQDPSGGTLIERGYVNNAYPHNEFASVFLYAHFSE
jgi:hypothetical protein